MTEPFVLSTALAKRIRDSGAPHVATVEIINPRFPTTAKTASPEPLGDDVLRRAAGFWKAGKNAQGRVMYDLLGGRNHMYAGGNQIAFIAHGALQLPGITGNYATMPNNGTNHPGIDPLGVPRDFDFRVLAALDSWTPASTMALLAKWQNSLVQNYVLAVTSTGALQFWWSTTGTDSHSATSTATLGLANFARKWVRATIDCDNGAGGYTVTFYTSDDGAQWQQLGDPIIGVGATQMPASNSIVEFGSKNNGSAWNAAGKIFRAQLYHSIDGQFFNGQRQFDVNFGVALDGALTFNDHDSAIKAFTGYVGRGIGDTTAQLLTVDDPLFDTTDLDVRFEVTLSDYGLRALGGRWPAVGNPSWNILVYQVNSAGVDLVVAFVQWVSAAGTPTWGVNLWQEGLIIPFPRNQRRWLRVTLDVDDGAGNHVSRFWQSVDNVHWIIAGEIVTPGTTALYAGSSGLEIGSFVGGNWQLNGILHAFDLRDAIDGDSIASIDLTEQPPNATALIGTDGRAWTITDISNTITVHQTAVSAAEPKYLDYTNDRYVWLPGTAGNYLSVPDEAALGITGDIDLRVDLAMDDWTPSATQLLLSKRASSLASAGSYWFYVNTSGTLALEWSNGTTNFSMVSTVAVGGTDKSRLWVRATLDVDDGAGHRVAKFYKSADSGATWAQIGATVTTTGTTSIRAGSEDLEIGAQYGGTSGPLVAKIFGAKILDGINGTVVFDLDVARSLFYLKEPYTAFAATSGQTVTINRTSTGLRSTVVDRPLFVMGVDDYFEAADASVFDFAASDDMSVAIAIRTPQSPPSANQTLVAKRAAATGTSAGWDMFIPSGVDEPRFAIGDGTTAVTADMPSSNATGDDFERSDRSLNNDNGWVTADSWAIVDGQAALTASTGGDLSFLLHPSAPTGHWELDAVLPGPSGDPAGTVVVLAGTCRTVSETEQVLFGFQGSWNAAGAPSYATAIVYATHPTAGTSYGVIDTATSLPNLGGSVLVTFDLDSSGNITLVIAGQTFTGTLDTTVLAALTSPNGGIISTSAPDSLYYPPFIEEFVGPGFGSDPTVWRTPVAARGPSTITAMMNGLVGTPVSDTTTGSLANSEPVRVGRLTGAGTSYAAIEFSGIGIWREALSASDAGRLRSELAS